MRSTTGSIPSLTDEEYMLLNELLEEHFGLQFPAHKRNVLSNRLRPRLALLRLNSFLEYYHVLQADGARERERLANLVTNNETYFFRERYQFEALFGGAVDGLRDNVVVPGLLRILCAGSSSGEEAYTLGFYAADHAAQLGDVQVRVDGFDLDTERVAIAKRGEYRRRSLRDMDRNQIDRYLECESEEWYRVRNEFRGGIAFRHGNIVDQASYRQPFRYDVVFCRNALIYFSRRALVRAIENFAAVLRPGGLLFLGHAESIIGLSDSFETARFDHCLAYRRTAK